MIFAAVAASVFLTSVLSGVFGMVGGLLLLGALLTLLPPVTALFLHGISQLLSNGVRAVTLRQHIRGDVLVWTTLGAGLAGFATVVSAYQPHEGWIFLIVGILSLSVWIPPSLLPTDVTRPSHAFLCGALAAGLTITVGAGGPAINGFFIRSKLNRLEIVGTKALIQATSHVMKIVFYGGLMDWGSGFRADMALAATVATVAVVGTFAGGFVLDRMTESAFQRWAKWLMTFTALWFAGTGAMILWRGG